MSDRAEGDRVLKSGGERLPLSGIRVLELGRYLAAPLVGQLLGDLGAEVVKIERRGFGDEFRQYGRTFVRDRDGNPTKESAPYVSANRNKRSVEVDLANPDGQRIVRSLARECDIFIENFKVGALDRFELDYASVRAANPGVIYLAISGFGQAGPYARKAATDSAFQAMSGLWDVNGEPEGQPQKIGAPASDYIGGLFGALSVMAALRHRDLHGEGQHIDLSLLDCSIAFLAPRSSEYLIDGTIPSRIGNRTPGTAPGQAFRCSDGHIMVQAGSDQMFATLCGILDRPDIAGDPRFANLQLRQSNVDVLGEALERAFLTRTGREWFDLLSEAGLIVAPIYDVAQCFADPQVQSRGMRVNIPHPGGGSVDVVASPMRFSATPIEHYSCPPPMGEGTDDVLSTWLGYDEAKIAELRASGAV